MCSSYANRIASEGYRTTFGVDLPLDFQHPAIIKPTDPAPIIVTVQGNRWLTVARWGFVPSYAKSLAAIKHLSLFNARDDALTQSGIWREAIGCQRCVIPLSHYFEGAKARGTKASVALADDQPLAVAGLWNRWRFEDGQEGMSCTMVTTEPSEDVKALHHRMPAMLELSEIEHWLNPATPLADALACVRPFRAGRLAVSPV